MNFGKLPLCLQSVLPQPFSFRTAEGLDQKIDFAVFRVAGSSLEKFLAPLTAIQRGMESLSKNAPAHLRRDDDAVVPNDGARNGLAT